MVVVAVAEDGAVPKSRWDSSNWTSGPVSFFNALGLSKWNIKIPTLQAELPGAVQQANDGPATATVPPSATPPKVDPSTLPDIGPTGGTPAQNKVLGQSLASVYGWGSGTQWTDLNNLVMQESGWNNTAQNPTSTAYGIGQFLDTTWATVNGQKTSNPTTQIKLMLQYIKQRYGSPSAAWAHEQKYNWY